MNPIRLGLSKNKKQELFREDLIKVLGIAFVIAVAAGLTYLSITYNSKCFIALGFWVLSIVVWFIPWPTSVFELIPLISPIFIAISCVIAFYCFKGNIETWLINCWDTVVFLVRMKQKVNNCYFF